MWPKKIKRSARARRKHKRIALLYMSQFQHHDFHLRTNPFQDEGNDMSPVELQKVIEELMILMIKAEEDKLDFNENWPVASKLALIRP